MTERNTEKKTARSRSKVPADEGIQVGSQVPQFELRDNTGRIRKLKDFRGKMLVLYFYPKDDTPGCTREACDFRDSWRRFNKAEVEVLGVSPDSPEQHQAFKEKYQLPFTLLSDPEKEVATRFGVYKEKSMYGKKFMGIERSTFLIDGDGTLLREFRKVTVAGHVEKLLAEIAKIKAQTT